MPLRIKHGIAFDLSEKDGSVLGVELDSREEFMDEYEDARSEVPTDDEILAFAREHMTPPECDWPLWSEAACNGVGEYPDLYPRR